MKVLGPGTAFGVQDSEPIYVTDRPDLCRWLVEHGKPSQLYAELDGAYPQGIVFIPTDWRRLPSASRLREQLAGTRVLWVPLGSFDARPEAASYSLDLLLRSDFSQAVLNNKSVMVKLLAPTVKRTFRAPGTELSFTLEEDVYINSRTRVELAKSEHASVGGYFEVELGANWVDKEETFHVSGYMRVEGILASHHRELPKELHGRVAEADNLLTQMRKRLPLTLEIEDSHVVAGALGDLDEVLRELTNPMYDGLLTELAFGTNTSINPVVDWRHNSQFNEGIGGLHVALGDVSRDHTSTLSVLMASSSLREVCNQSNHWEVGVIIRQAPGVDIDVDSVSGEALLVNAHTLTAARINGSGVRILELARAGGSVSEVVAGFAAWSQATGGESRRAVCDFLDHLEDDGWIERIDTCSSEG